MFRMNDSHDRGHWETIVTQQSHVEDGIRLQEIANLADISDATISKATRWQVHSTWLQ